MPLRDLYPRETERERETERDKDMQKACASNNASFRKRYKRDHVVNSQRTFTDATWCRNTKMEERNAVRPFSLKKWL